ncbi:MAG: hypothetical protein MZV70_22560 [Desulfobacterales bacterium]|nr:hypothetical protein [Desulfobacterales bacterium]
MLPPETFRRLGVGGRNKAHPGPCGEGARERRPVEPDHRGIDTNHSERVEAVGIARGSCGLGAE